jgi:hypothetical protein
MPDGWIARREFAAGIEGDLKSQTRKMQNAERSGDS